MEERPRYRRTMEKKCPEPDCGSMNVQRDANGAIAGPGVLATEPGGRLPTGQGYFFNCQACNRVFIYLGENP